MCHCCCGGRTHLPNYQDFIGSKLQYVLSGGGGFLINNHIPALQQINQHPSSTNFPHQQTHATHTHTPTDKGSRQTHTNCTPHRSPLVNLRVRWSANGTSHWRP